MAEADTAAEGWQEEVRLDREPYEHDMVEIGPLVGSVVQLVDPKPTDKKKRKNPIGFCLPENQPRKRRGKQPGAWPKVGRL